MSIMGIKADAAACLSDAETYFLWFVLYSTLGWIYETILYSVKQKRFVNRGFLNGPYCPIYGFGAILNLLVLGRMQSFLLLFPAAALLTGVLEYTTSWGMEKLFHARWWDYSDKRFNINGRVYLTGAIAFGLFSVFQLKYLQPVFSAFTLTLPDTVRAALFLTLFALLLIDTVYTVTKFSEFEKVLNDMTNSIDGAVQSVKTLYKKANATRRGKVRKINSQIRRMLVSFPRLSSIRYGDRLKKLRELIKNENGGRRR